MRVLVTGGRDYADRRRVFEELDALDNTPSGPIALIVEGGASGADEHARAWAQGRERTCVTCWAQWAKYGKAAGPIRNREMLEDWNPRYVLAFPGGIGTKNMVTQARAREILVLEPVP